MSDALPSDSEAQVIRTKLRTWFLANGRHLPWREDPSPYAVLISEIMLQQTQVVTVIPYFKRWILRFPTVQVLAEADEASVLHLWQGLGYYSRARNLHAAAKLIVERFQGNLPNSPELLESLPGIGRYTAGAICAFAFDLPTPAVDANIARVISRITNLSLPVDSPKGTNFVWSYAESLLNGESGGRTHTSALMELGALVCSPKKPQCLVCPIQSHCSSPEPETLPIKSPRKATVLLTENAAWIAKNGLVLLEQQKGRKAGGLWKLPAFKDTPDGSPLYQTVYPFTNHRITLRVFNSPHPVELQPDCKWFSSNTILNEAALTAPHRRALKHLLARHD